MKIVREEIDYKKQMENNNKNMKKSKETDTVIAVDPTYADAMEQDKKAEEKVGEIMKKKKEEQKPIETPDPSTGKPLKKNMYTKQEELDESLFDDGEGEEVEEEKNPTKLPEDVFTMVYDFIFDGLHKTPASIKGLEDVEDVVVGAEKYFQDVQNFTNIGVQIRNDEKDIADYVKKIADALGFSTSEKRYERGVKNGDYVLFVEIPKDVAVMKASRFLGKNESLKEGNGSSSRSKMEQAIDIVEDLADTARGLIARGNYDKKSAIDRAIDNTLIYDDDIVALGWYFDAIDTHELLEDIYPQLIGEIEERIDNDDKDESLKEGKSSVKFKDANNWDTDFTKGDKYAVIAVDKYSKKVTSRHGNILSAITDELLKEVQGSNFFKNPDFYKQENSEKNESLKESRSPRFELEIWVPGSGGDDERERPLIKSDSIDDILRTAYNTELDDDEAFLFTDTAYGGQLDQEYSAEQLEKDIRFEYGMDESKKCKSKKCKEKELEEGKKLTETIEGENILDDLVDRAIMNLKDGIDDGSTDVEKAVERAIDDGLIYNDDILSLGIHYNAVDTDKILADIYDTLTSDLIGKVTEKLGETDKSTDESLKEGKKPVVEQSETKVEKYRGMTIEEIFWDVVGDKFKVFDADGKFTPKAEKNYNKVAKAYGEDAFDELCNSEKCFKEGKSLKEAKNKLTEDAKIYISLSDYKPWSGAVETFEKIRKEDKMDELDAFIEEMYPDGLTDTELNDLLWFEPEYVFDSLGIDYDKDEDEEDEDDEIELDFEEEDEEETDEE